MMCDALRELYQEEINAAAERKVQEVAQQVTQQVTQQVIRQELCRSIQKLIKHLKITVEQAMDVLEIPLEDRNSISFDGIVG